MINATAHQIHFVKNATIDQLYSATEAQSNAITALAQELMKQRTISRQRHGVISVINAVICLGLTLCRHAGRCFKARKPGTCALSGKPFYTSQRVRYIRLQEWSEDRLVSGKAFEAKKFLETQGIYWSTPVNEEVNAHIAAKNEEYLSRVAAHNTCPTCGSDCGGECLQ